MTDRLQEVRLLVRDKDNPLWRLYPNTTRITALNCPFVVGVDRCGCLDKNKCSLMHVRHAMVSELEIRLSENKAAS